ncbi:MAG: DNA polymerase III subunit beta [Verrucomicrobia bacterium]|nr:DNA polymerase III subunit beta [Verrucomicrobiota bacterium]
MKLHVTKEKILDGLQKIQNVVSVRSTLPILSNTLLIAEKDGLCLTATDLDVGIRCRIAAEVLKQGSATVPCRKLFSILRELPSQDFDLEVDEKNTMSLRSGGSFFRILGLPAEEFPRFPSFPEIKEIKIDQSVLRSLLKRTAYAASTDDTRFVLNGVFWSFKAEKLTMVATDGRRLALAEAELAHPVSSEMEFILPSKAVSELSRLLADAGDACIRVTENQILFELGDSILASKLVEGVFPNFRQVIPSDSKERIKIERESLLAALHRVSILVSERQNAVKLNFSKNSLSISASAPEVGEAKESLPINYKGKDISIGFNPQFLMDPLRNLDADEVIMELTDELSPGVLKIDAPFLYVIMPMRLN